MKFILSLVTLTISCAISALEPVNLEPANTESVSIIYMIGDGMGPAYTSAYRYYIDNPNTEVIEQTIFDELLVGMASTYPRDNTLVTDSAAAATALATGYKTNNGIVGLGPDLTPLLTLLERAKELGYNTGLVVTSQVNHATPASFIAHIDSRNKYNEIADQYLDHRIASRLKIDLMLGGGLMYFQRKDRNLLAEFDELGYQIITDYRKLVSLKTLPVIGLFAPKGMQHAIDSDDKIRLATMTNKALSLLDEKPFFLLVEGSQIDWCGHSNDIACAMAEVHDFAEALKVAKQYVEQHPNTLLVATADHSTGGLSLGSNGKYLWQASIVREINASAKSLTKALLASPNTWQNIWLRETKISLSPKSQEDFQTAIDAWDAILKTEGKNNLIEKKVSAIQQIVIKLINQHSHTGWTSNGHTADDVQIFSMGRSRELFFGSMDNTDIAKKIFTILE